MIIFILKLKKKNNSVSLIVTCIQEPLFSLHFKVNSNCRDSEKIHFLIKASRLACTIKLFIL